jgi:hypothetical protein
MLQPFGITPKRMRFGKTDIQRGYERDTAFDDAVARYASQADCSQVCPVVHSVHKG